MAVGSGLYYIGVVTAFFIVLAQILLHQEVFTGKERKGEVVKLVLKNQSAGIDELRSVLSEEQIDIISVDWDTRVRVNGRCPLVIRCQAVTPADGRVYVFQSEAFWFDPSPFLEGLSTLPVYVDGDDYRSYAVDTAGIVPQQG